MKPLVALLVTVTLLCSKARTQSDDVSAICRAAAENIQRLESIAAFKLHGMVSVRENAGGEGEKYETWIEMRGNKVWSRCLKIHPVGSADEEESRRFKELLKTDLFETRIFDGRKMISHSPTRLQVTIEDKTDFEVPRHLKPVFPASWTGFMFAANQGKTTFEVLLTSRLPECDVVFNQQKNEVIVSHKLPPSSKPSLHDERKLRIDSSSMLIVYSKVFGGKGIPIESELEWKAWGDIWYVSKGKVDYGPLIVEWEIDQFTADPREVRTAFALDKAELPIGTRIDVEPHSKQKRREVEFVGGEEGLREYKLKRESIRLISGKSDEDQ
jgi:hypothetical protein